MTVRRIEPRPNPWGHCNKAIGLLYEKVLAETFRLASARVGDHHCSVAAADHSSSWIWNDFIRVSLSRGAYRHDLG